MRLAGRSSALAMVGERAPAAANRMNPRRVPPCVVTDSPPSAVARLRPPFYCRLFDAIAMADVDFHAHGVRRAAGPPARRDLWAAAGG